MLGCGMGRTSWPGVPDLPEGEGVSFGAGVGERDLEGALGDGSVLPDELVQPLLGEGAEPCSSTSVP